MGATYALEGELVEADVARVRCARAESQPASRHQGPDTGIVAGISADDSARNQARRIIAAGEHRPGAYGRATRVTAVLHDAARRRPVVAGASGTGGRAAVRAMS